MTYLSNLKWMRTLEDFNDQQRKVLIALSHERFKWRTIRNISKASGLSVDETNGILSGLINNDLVRPASSKSKKAIFGLRERVG